MKKNIYRLFIFFLTTTAMFSCSEDDGTEPGSDSNPMVTIYQYTPKSPYSADNDVSLRFATNNKTTELYYLAEKTAKKDSLVSALGKDAYMQRVVSTGVKVNDISGASNADVILTNLKGVYTITAVAVGSGSMTSSDISFMGLDLQPYAEGTYYSDFFGSSWSATLLYDANLKVGRFKDCWMEGYDVTFSWDGSSTVVVNNGGKFETGYVHSKYGMVSVTPVTTAYDVASKTFTFSYKWTVSLGSFGTYDDTYTITSLH